MHSRVPITFFAAYLAGSCARLEQESAYQPFRLGLSQQDVSCRGADVCTIEIKANAPDQFLHHIFAQAGIGASDARLGAVKAGLDTLHETVHIGLQPLGMGLHHFTNMIHD